MSIRRTVVLLDIVTVVFVVVALGLVGWAIGEHEMLAGFAGCMLLYFAGGFGMYAVLLGHGKLR